MPNVNMVGIKQTNIGNTYCFPRYFLLLRRYLEDQSYTVCSKLIAIYMLVLNDKKYLRSGKPTAIYKKKTYLTIQS